MRLADAIWQRLKQEVDVVYYLPGGGCAPLVDALGQSGIQSVCCLHEQGAGFAAVGYAQHHGFGVCLVTSGPGVTNAITPCLAAWLDSVPVLFIGGQVPSKQLAYVGLRSRGTQEAPTIKLVTPITKKVVMATTGNVAMMFLPLLIKTAREGRQGPVWLDICMDVQSEEV